MLSSRRLRVAIVAPSLGILGGQAVQADRLVRAWRDDPDVEAWLVPINPVPAPPLKFALDIKYLRTVVTELAYLPRLRELRHADVVHVFSASYSSFLLAPLPAIVAARLMGRPVILNYRSGEAPDHLRRSALARWTIARVDRNIVPSRFLVDVFQRFGIAASVIPNIVDVDRLRYRVRDPLRAHLLSTRNFDVHYDVACTVRAFRLVQDRWPDARLTLVGGGPLEKELRALVDRLQLRHVTFAGRVSPDDIAAFYAAADIYVQSPVLDNMPTSVIEAYASGLPVVSTEAGGVPAILMHGRDGLLAPPGDHDRLADRVLTLLDDPRYARRLAENAYAIARRCTWPAVRGQWLEAYHSVLSETAVAPGGASSAPTTS